MRTEARANKGLFSPTLTPTAHSTTRGEPVEQVPLFDCSTHMSYTPFVPPMRGSAPQMFLLTLHRDLIMLSFLYKWLAAMLVGLSTVSAAADTLGKIEHIVIIYGENRSFDNLYGLFP